MPDLIIEPIKYQLINTEVLNAIVNSNDNKNFPYVMLTYNYKSFFNIGTAIRTSSCYTHACWLSGKNTVSTQNWKMKQVSFSEYLDGKTRIKLISGKNWTNAQKESIKWKIQDDVNAKGRYDYLGILGQLIGIPSLNANGRHYCSEEVTDILKGTDRFFKDTFNIEHPNPSEINKYVMAHSDRYFIWVYDPTL